MDMSDTFSKYALKGHSYTFKFKKIFRGKRGSEYPNVYPQFTPYLSNSMDMSDTFSKYASKGHSYTFKFKCVA